MQICSNCLRKNRLFLPDTGALQYWLRCLCSTLILLMIPSVYFLFHLASSLFPAWPVLILPLLSSCFSHLEKSLLNFSACVNTGHLMSNNFWVPIVCWPWGKTPKVVSWRKFLTSEKSQLEWGWLLEWRVLWVRERIFYFPNCCTPQCKCSLSLALFSSFYNKEIVA